jgi:hypothetical protein
MMMPRHIFGAALYGDFVSCYAHFVHVIEIHTGPKVFKGAALKCVHASPVTSWMGKWAVEEKKELIGNIFVLPAIRTLCLYYLPSSARLPFKMCSQTIGDPLSCLCLNM